jgi:hypothetical protein
MLGGQPETEAFLEYIQCKDAQESDINHREDARSPEQSSIR